MTNKNNFFKILSFSVVIIVILLSIYFIQKPDKNLHIYFLNVGQGDSIYVRTMYDYDILIDGGPDKSILSELDQVMPFWDRNIDLLILTHPHSDHLFGLIEILKRYNVNKIIMSDAIHTSNEYLEWLETIKEKNIQLEIIDSAKSQEIDRQTKLEFFWPKESYKDKKVNDLNETSIVTKLVFDKFSVLFTGDIDQDVENKSINQSANLESNILKIPHHGSKTSLSENFLDKVNPEIAIISAGEKNKFGHPAELTLEKLNKLKIKIYRTDINGRIEVISNGQFFWTRLDSH